MTFLAALSKRAGLGSAARRVWAETASNRRARIGLILIAALVGVCGLVTLHRATAGRIAVYKQESAELARIVQIARQREWPQHAEESAKLRTALEDRLWTAESAGVAQADLQAWIAEVGREIGMPIFDIRVEATRIKNLAPDLRQITATITGQPSEAAVIGLLERVARAPHLIVESRLHVRQQPSPVLELVLVGYARIAGVKPGAEQ
jgi:hypothetical protein